MKRRWMMLVFSVLLLLGFLGTIALPKASAQPPVVPCTDPRGCPDLTVDKNRLRQWYPVKATFSPEDCAVQEGFTKPGTRRLLLFIYSGSHTDHIQNPTCLKKPLASLGERVCKA
jgi:hypothetical protein